MMNLHDSWWWTIMIHDDEPSWFMMMSHHASWWWAIMIHDDESSWFVMMNHHDSWWSIIMPHHDESPWWMMNHHNESWWIIMTNHDESAWCISMMHRKLARASLRPMTSVNSKLARASLWSASDGLTDKLCHRNWLGFGWSQFCDHPPEPVHKTGGLLTALLRHTHNERVNHAVLGRIPTCA